MHSSLPLNLWKWMHDVVSLYSTNISFKNTPVKVELLVQYIYSSEKSTGSEMYSKQLSK